MYRIGVITEVDPERARARVRWRDRAVDSWWLDLLQPKTHRDQAYWMPDTGDQVVCLVDAGAEAGVVLGALYSAPDPVPVTSPDKRHTRWADGAIEEYDRARHRYTLSLPDAGEIALTVGAATITMTDGAIRLAIGDSALTLGGDAIVLRTPAFKGEQA